MAHKRKFYPTESGAKKLKLEDLCGSRSHQCILGVQQTHQNSEWLVCLFELFEIWSQLTATVQPLGWDLDEKNRSMQFNKITSPCKNKYFLHSSQYFFSPITMAAHVLTLNNLTFNMIGKWCTRWNYSLFSKHITHTIFSAEEKTFPQKIPFKNKWK